MHFKSSFAILSGLASAFVYHVSPVSAIPAGTIALQEWFVGVIPRIFPNSTDNWQGSFEDGTVDSNIIFKMNAADATTGIAAMRVRGMESPDAAQK